MREIKYLSPSAIMAFMTSPEDFFIDRLAATRFPSMAQNQAMSIGSAFDAYAKSALHEMIFGKGADPKFEFTTLFEAQVEPQNRDWALINGKVAYEKYKYSGAFADLLLDMQRAKGGISFEGTIEGTIGGVPLLGKPDAYYVNKDGHPVILDWKVNGFTSNSNTSPKPGYVRLRDTQPHGFNSSVSHKDCVIKDHKGVRINSATTLNKVAFDWSMQLSIYGWLYGQEVGGDFICAIDQLACNGSKRDKDGYPTIRVAEHRLLVCADFQKRLLQEIQSIWQRIQSGYIFTDLSREENDAKIALLESRAAGYASMPEMTALVRERPFYGFTPEWSK